MNIKKVVSLFMAVVIVLTLSVNCYASDIIDSDIMPGAASRRPKVGSSSAGDVGAIPDIDVVLGTVSKRSKTGSSKINDIVEIPDIDVGLDTASKRPKVESSSVNDVVVIPDIDEVIGTTSELPQIVSSSVGDVVVIPDVDEVLSTDSKSPEVVSSVDKDRESSEVGIAPSVVGPLPINCVDDDIVILSTDIDSSTATQPPKVSGDVEADKGSSTVRELPKSSVHEGVEISSTAIAPSYADRSSEIVSSDVGDDKGFSTVSGTASRISKWKSSKDIAHEDDAVIKQMHEDDAAKQKELDELNKKVIEKNTECTDLRIDLDKQIMRLQDWSNDVLCRNCSCCCASKSHKAQEIPISSTIRSKKFYLGMVSGVAAVAVVMGLVILVKYICKIYFMKK